jgi:molybdopterin-containing oxidoreductase family membrane subunit
MANDYLVVGHFRHVDDTQHAIRQLRESGETRVELFTPFPSHDLEEEMYFGQKRSPVRRVTLTGGITGLLGAFLMTCWMSIDYPLRVSAKPLISVPAFIVIGFECTILLGSLFNMLGMFHFSRIPSFFRNPGFRPNFTNGTFGLTVRVPEEKAEKFKQMFEAGGAEKVEVQYVR